MESLGGCRCTGNGDGNDSVVAAGPAGAGGTLCDRQDASLRICGRRNGLSAHRHTEG